MAQESPETLVKRADAAWQKHLQWKPMLEDAYRYALPHRNLYTEESEGQEKTVGVWDSTAIVAVQRFASRWVNDVVPPYARHIEFEPGAFLNLSDDERVEAARLTRQWTEMYHLVLTVGGFHTASHEFALDLATGRAAMLVEEADDETIARFTVVPRAQVAIEEGAHAQGYGAVFRKPVKKARLIEVAWPDVKIPGGSDLAEKLKTDEGREAEIELCEVTYRDHAAGVWRYELILPGRSQGEAVRLVERTYRYSSPWIITRYWKVPGEVEGRGPLLSALPDIRTLNRVVEFTLKAAALAIVGVYTVESMGVEDPDSVAIRPGAMIRVRSNAGPRGAAVQPLDTARNFDVSQIVLESLRMNIKKVLLDDQLPPDAGAVRSPTEIVARMKELNQDAGAAFGRFFQEFYRPLAQRVLDILHNRALIERRVELNELTVRVNITSPLARMQRLADVEKVMQWAEIAQGLVGQEAALLYLYIERIVPWLARQLGVDPDLVRSKVEREEIEAAVANLVSATATEGGGPRAASAREAA